MTSVPLESGLGLPLATEEVEMLAVLPVPVVAVEVGVDCVMSPVHPMVDVGQKVSYVKHFLDAAGPLVGGKFTSKPRAAVNPLKRLAVSELPKPWKRYKALSVNDDMAVVVQQRDGKLWVSPQKKKRGRPFGSKNKPKPTVVEPKKARKKNSFSSGKGKGRKKAVRKLDMEGLVALDPVGMDLVPVQACEREVDLVLKPAGENDVYSPPKEA